MLFGTEPYSMKKENISLETQLSAWCAETFAACFPGIDLSSIPVAVTPSKNEQFGDCQCEAAMKIAKELKTNPRVAAQQFVEKAVLPDFVEKVEIAGPGFINIYLKTSALAAQLESMQADAKLGLPNLGKNQTVIIDYSSPNVAKPMHIGHIRSTVIGNALDRLYRALGYHVIADNHLGDWGTQFGLIILGYREFADADALKASVSSWKKELDATRAENRADELESEASVAIASRSAAAGSVLPPGSVSSSAVQARAGSPGRL